MRSPAIFSLVLALSMLPAALGDKVYLKDKRVLEGKVERKGDWVIVKKRLGEVRVHADAVLRIEKGAPLDDQFQTRWKAVDRKDPAALRGLADWCRASGLPARADWLEGLARVAELVRRADALKPQTPAGLILLYSRALASGYKSAQARFLLERILTRHPDHARARELLGYRKYKGVWYPAKEAYAREERDVALKMREKGLVKFGGKWVRPEEAKTKQYVANLFKVIEQKETQILALSKRIGELTIQLAAQRKQLEAELVRLKQRLAQQDTNKSRRKTREKIQKLDKRIVDIIRQNRRLYRKLLKYNENKAGNRVRIKATEKQIQSNENEFNSLLKTRTDLWSPTIKKEGGE